MCAHSSPASPAALRTWPSMSSAATSLPPGSPTAMLTVRSTGRRRSWTRSSTAAAAPRLSGAQHAHPPVKGFPTCHRMVILSTHGLDHSFQLPLHVLLMTEN